MEAKLADRLAEGSIGESSREMRKAKYSARLSSFLRSESTMIRMPGFLTRFPHLTTARLPCSWSWSEISFLQMRIPFDTLSPI